MKAHSQASNCQKTPYRQRRVGLPRLYAMAKSTLGWARGLVQSKLSIPLVWLVMPLLFAGAAQAQKSSGVLQPQEPADNYSASVVQVDDDVIRAASATGDEIRFLIKAKREAEISSTMSGKIQRIHFNVGQRFKKGQTLVSMDCAEIEARYQAQQAKVRAAKLTWQADAQMLEGAAVSRYTMESSKAAYDEQLANLKEAAAVRGHCRVIAPFSGGVVSVVANAFESVSSSEPLLTIIDDSGLRMSLNIPSSFVNRVKQGDTFTVVVDETGKTYSARVVGVSPMIDPVSKTIEVRAAITSGLDEIAPGMSGRANLDFTQ